MDEETESHLPYIFYKQDRSLPSRLDTALLHIVLSCPGPVL